MEARNLQEIVERYQLQCHLQYIYFSASWGATGRPYETALGCLSACLGRGGPGLGSGARPCTLFARGLRLAVHYQRPGT